MCGATVVIGPRDRITGRVCEERALRCAFVEEVPDDVDMDFGREGEALGRAPGWPERPMSGQDRRVRRERDTRACPQACRAASDRWYSGLHAVGRVERRPGCGEEPCHDASVEQERFVAGEAHRFRLDVAVA